MRVYIDTSVIGGCLDEEFREVEILELSQAAQELAEAYIREGAVGSGCMADAQHIAAATMAKVDVLVSWNFKHIVNYRRIQLYNAVNLKQGYALIDIRTPREVLDEKGV